MSEALRLDGVAVRLGGRAVLRGVDLTLGAGEVLGLLGGNGAGKTTLLRLVTRVLHPDGGQLFLLGRPLAGFARRELAQRVAVVPQETSLPFPFRVGEIVLMGRSPHLGWLGFEGGADLHIAHTAMERLGIEALADRPIQELSGGERQLAVVARALAQEPALLLLDEPTAFLDLRHRVAVLQVVRRHAAEGGSAVVVSHDLGLAGRFCDRLALLAEGRVLVAGSPREVLTPTHLRRAFGIEARVASGPDGEPLVIPEAVSGAPDAAC